MISNGHSVETTIDVVVVTTRLAARALLTLAMATTRLVRETAVQVGLGMTTARLSEGTAVGTELAISNMGLDRESAVVVWHVLAETSLELGGKAVVEASLTTMGVGRGIATARMGKAVLGVGSDMTKLTRLVARLSALATLTLAAAILTTRAILLVQDLLDLLSLLRVRDADNKWTRGH